MAATPMTNGHGVIANGHAESSSSPMHSFEEHEIGVTPDHPQNGFSSHNDDLVNYLYHSGFQTGNYSDVILQVQQHSYRLHAIILARSPFLAHLMSTSPTNGGQRVIYVPLEQEPEVTQEGFAIALGYLYSSISLTLVRPENCRGVLAAGRLLGGMDDLCRHAYDECKRSISVHSIDAWLAFVDSLPTSVSDGISTPSVANNTIFGDYARKMRDDVFHFLVVVLPELLEERSQDSLSSPTGREVLLQTYSKVPFDMFKSAVESPMFNIGSDQARFKFAKEVIEIRKRGIARAPGAEETVVLAFGGGNFGGHAVHITRKLKKRPLWKVNC